MFVLFCIKFGDGVVDDVVKDEDDNDEEETEEGDCRSRLSSELQSQLLETVISLLT